MSSFQLSDWTVTQLRECCEYFSLSQQGRKIDLIDTIDSFRNTCGYTMDMMQHYRTQLPRPRKTSKT